MNTTSRVITGGVAGILGLLLIIYSLPNNWSTIFYGLAIILIGGFIFFNKKEDEIEKINKDKDNKNNS